MLWRCYLKRFLQCFQIEAVTNTLKEQNLIRKRLRIVREFKVEELIAKRRSSNNKYKELFEEGFVVLSEGKKQDQQKKRAKQKKKVTDMSESHSPTLLPRKERSNGKNGKSLLM